METTRFRAEPDAIYKNFLPETSKRVSQCTGALLILNNYQKIMTFQSIRGMDSGDGSYLISAGQTGYPGSEGKTR
jgi:hypothetical protein